MRRCSCNEAIRRHDRQGTQNSVGTKPLGCQVQADCTRIQGYQHTNRITGTDIATIWAVEPLTSFMRGDMTRFQQFCTSCNSCGGSTSKKFAREHDGKCKTCATGVERPHRGPKCPQCGAPISAYKAQHNYVCEGCVRVNDPAGWANEVRGFYD